MPIFLTRNHSASIDELAASLGQMLHGPPSDELIIVVPTNRKIRDLQRQLIRRAPRGASAHLNLLTLELLARKLHDACCPPRQLVAKPLQAVLLQEAVRSVNRQDGLKYFSFSHASGALRLSTGTFQKLLDTVNLLKESGVYPEDLWSELRELNKRDSAAAGETAKLEDLCRIYDSYEQALGTEFVDVGGIFKALTIRLRSGESEDILRKVLPTARLMVINGFDEFSSPELRMISSLSSLKSLTTVVSFDCYPENRELFGHLYENYEVLLEMGFARVRNDSKLNAVWIFNPSSDPELSQALSVNLFQNGSQTGRLDRKEKITLFSAKDRKEEVRLIAKTIKLWFQDHPEQDPGRICVATYQTQSYTSFVRELFSEYGIPVNVTDRFYLSQSPIVIALLSLLDIPKNNFRRRDVLRALGSPYVRLEHKEGKIDAANLYTVSTNLKLRIDADTWLERIEKRLLTLDKERGDLDGELDEEDIDRERVQLETAQRDIRWLWELLAPFKQPMKPAEFRRRLLMLLQRLRVGEQLFSIQSGGVTPIDLEKDLRAYNRFLLMIDDVLEVLRLQGLSDETLALEFYVDQLRTAAQQVRYNVRERSGYGVLVTSLEETRGIDFDMMFVAGLVDGEFPLTYQPEVFLSTSRQRKKERYHLTENRYLFYQGIRNFSGHLYVSYPERDREFELVPSTFVDALLTLVNVEDARGTYADRFKDKVFSQSELLEALEYGMSFATAESRREVRDEIRFVRHARSIERSRYLTHDRMEYEGIIVSLLNEKARERLAAFSKKVYSVSQLETYGKCPFRFFAERVLRLNTLREPEDGLSPREKGSVLHSALFEFFIDRRTRGLPWLDECSDQQFDEAVRQLTRFVQERLNEIQVDDVFWEFDREKLLGSSTRRGIVEQLLLYERDRRIEVRPRYFELSFGRRGRSVRESDPLIRLEEPITVGNLRLRGKVDRVEVGKDIFSIIDYKTGAAPTHTDILSGLSLQLPLYLAALEPVLTRYEGRPMKSAAGIYFVLKDEVLERIGLGASEYRERSFHVPPRKRPKLFAEGAFRSVINDALTLADKYVQSIALGEFPLTKEELTSKVCTHCQFKTMCRIQSRQWVGNVGLVSEDSG